MRLNALVICYRETSLPTPAKVKCISHVLNQPRSSEAHRWLDVQQKYFYDTFHTTCLNPDIDLVR